jgi:hypothetical protein
MKTIVTSLALAAIFGLAAPATSQAGDAHHGGGHHSSYSQPNYGHGGYQPSYGHGGYQPGHSGYYQHGYQSGHGYGHAPSYPNYGHGGYQSGYGHGGYQPNYGHGGSHISLPGIHFSFGGHGAHH